MRWKGDGKTRLIDADALRQKIENWKNDADKGNLFSDSVESFAYDEVMHAIDEAPTVKPKTPWISVNDALPDDNETVVVYGKEYDELDFGIRYKGTWEYVDSDFYGDQIHKVTHWMPCTKPED